MPASKPPATNRDARSVVKATRLSEVEASALAQALVAEMAPTASTYIADAVHARLVIDGLLVEGAAPPAPAKSSKASSAAKACKHSKTRWTGYARICEACGEVVKR